MREFKMENVDRPFSLQGTWVQDKKARSVSKVKKKKSLYGMVYMILFHSSAELPFLFFIFALALWFWNHLNFGQLLFLDPGTGDVGLIPGSGRPPGEGNGNPLQYSCLENLMDRAIWQATVHQSCYIFISFLLYFL